MVLNCVVLKLNDYTKCMRQENRNIKNLDNVCLGTFSQLSFFFIVIWFVFWHKLYNTRIYQPGSYILVIPCYLIL